ncbi:unnamed protein product [Brassica oleracea]
MVGFTQLPRWLCYGKKEKQINILFNINVKMRNLIS